MSAQVQVYAASPDPITFGRIWRMFSGLSWASTRRAIWNRKPAPSQSSHRCRTNATSKIPTPHFSSSQRPSESNRSNNTCKWTLTLSSACDSKGPIQTSWPTTGSRAPECTGTDDPAWQYALPISGWSGRTKSQSAPSNCLSNHRDKKSTILFGSGVRHDRI